MSSLLLLYTVSYKVHVPLSVGSVTAVVSWPLTDVVSITAVGHDDCVRTPIDILAPLV